jgi:hypothetical protein
VRRFDGAAFVLHGSQCEKESKDEWRNMLLGSVLDRALVVHLVTKLLLSVTLEQGLVRQEQELERLEPAQARPAPEWGKLEQECGHWCRSRGDRCRSW